MSSEPLVVTEETTPEQYRAAREEKAGVTAELPAEEKKEEAPKPEAEAAAEADAAKANEVEPEVPAKDGKKKPWYQERFDELTRDKHELRSDNERLRAEISQLRAAGKPAEPPKDDDPEPQPDDFETTAEYVKATADWSARNALKARDAENAKKEQEAKDKEFLNAYRTRVSEFAKAHDDFNSVVATVNFPQKISGPLQIAVMEMEQGPAVAYHLGKHPELVTKLSGMTPSAALRELGRIEAVVESEIAKSAPAKAAEPVKSKAPDPITPVGGANAKGAVDLSDPELSPEDYRKAREAERKNRRN